ncbi:RagB/SusD family nutrient uptake outer membrane protein [Pedobacter sp. HMWF019]|uniref:RagB/SusD family nutrient uptake outer membrane protein n=1 Tax=Pedobacter sp. HMWF019 TaxID=2056856 RepID=UPI000D3CAD8C|nr:RagB/SusD family nutrient uptake outer membrane protein [Pedobacter sp. HMWF019]PTS95366.1 RagB/SusD family nutrient uptake outer membrane protein [Pedobacter sp. HMWF019]
MKSYIKLTLCFLTLFAACKKDFLETTPTDKVAQTTIFENLSNAKLALNGTYRLLYLQISNQSQDGHGAMMINMDAIGEDMVWSGNTYSYFKPALRWVDHRTASSGLAAYPYRLYYRVISNANMIIANIDKVEGAEEEKGAIKGEAVALRAWCHLQLVQIYGKRYETGKENTQPGIPVMVSDDGEDQPRSSVENVYKQINADLDQAISLLNAAPKRSYKTHIDVNVAKGIKARVALITGKWQDAIKFAKEARSEAPLMSNTEYLDGFTSIKNNEWMWGANQLSDQIPTYGSFYSYMSGNFNSAWNRLEPKMINSVLYAKITATDIRKKLWWDGTAAEKVNFPGAIDAATGVTASGTKIIKYMHRKFKVADVASRAGDIPFMRAAEMYLIEAEALARSGQDGEAQSALYTLALKRDPAYTRSVKTGQDLVEEILVQRRIELWGEGFRFFDLKRTDSDLNRNGMDNPRVNSAVTYLDIAYTLFKDRPSKSNDWEFKIPQDEIDVNKKLGPADQNP